MPAVLYCGVDVALRMNRARFKDAEGNECRPRLSFPNDANGATTFLNVTFETLRKGALDEVRIGMEATNFLAWHLAMLVAKCPQLSPFQPKVYMFNPKVIKRFKGTYTDARKDDWFDAGVIADRLRFGHPLPIPFDSDDRYLPLKRLTRHRFHLVKQLVREKNYFLSYLFLKCSTLAQDGPLSSPFCESSVELITEYASPEEIVEAPLEQLAQLLADRSRNRINNPDQVAQEYQKAARNAYRLPDRLKDPVNRIMASTLRTIRHLEHEIKLVGKEIEHEMSGFATPLLTVSGIGPVYAAGILGEIGDIRNYVNDSKIAKMAGLTWKRQASGDFVGDDSYLSRTGNPYLRYYLIEAANKVRMHDSEYKAYYQRKYDEAKIHKHKRGIVLTARKLVRLVFALLRENRPYIKPEKRG
jgi:hypothetical protein